MNETKLDPSGVQHEIDFWRKFVQTERFQGWVRDVPTPELSPAVQALLAMMSYGRERPLEALDVGSGPVSILRGLPRVNVSTCDPLTELYQGIFDYPAHGIIPPIRYPAEDIPSMYHGDFDVVHISNALDHTVEPLGALLSLVACCQDVGGFLVVQGFVNEAWHEGFQGFHQHNLSLFRDNLIVSSGRAGLKLEVRPDDLGARIVWAWQGGLPSLGNREWFIWVVQRTRSNP